jgi:hypothetical protein
LAEDMHISELMRAMPFGAAQLATGDDRFAIAAHLPLVNDIVTLRT